jgi:hypothetical protein
MKVSELITLLQVLNPDHDVVISGNELGYGKDFGMVEVHQYNDTNYVRLIPGDDYEEDDAE